MHLPLVRRILADRLAAIIGAVVIPAFLVEREGDPSADTYYGRSPVIGKAVEPRLMKMPIFSRAVLQGGGK